MSRLDTKRRLHQARTRRIRNVIRGTADRPRLSVNITNSAISAQVINDLTGQTLFGVQTKPGNVTKDSAAAFGAEVAKGAKKAKVSKVVLDRGGRKYHGRLNAFAEAARKEGLDF